MSNMYNFVSKCWNPLAGKCIHECNYCFVTKMKRFPVMNKKYSGEPRLIESEFKKKFKPDDVVFVVDCADLFAKNVPSEMIKEILNRCSENPATYYFQSKNPERMLDFVKFFPENSILCTTIETDQLRLMHYSGGQTFRERDLALSKLSTFGFTTEITIEPIMQIDDIDYFAYCLLDTDCSKINIGANSDRSLKLPEPTKEQVVKLIIELEKFTVVYQKDNLKRLLK